MEESKVQWAGNKYLSLRRIKISDGLVAAKYRSPEGTHTATVNDERTSELPTEKYYSMILYIINLIWVSLNLLVQGSWEVCMDLIV